MLMLLLARLCNVWVTTDWQAKNSDWGCWEMMLSWLSSANIFAIFYTEYNYGEFMWVVKGRLTFVGATAYVQSGFLLCKLVSWTILCMVQCKFCEYGVLVRLNMYWTAPDSRFLLRCTKCLEVNSASLMRLITKLIKRTVLPTLDWTAPIWIHGLQ
jgi:hypothetical protein